MSGYSLAHGSPTYMPDCLVRNASVTVRRNRGESGSSGGGNEAAGRGAWPLRARDGRGGGCGGGAGGGEGGGGAGGSTGDGVESCGSRRGREAG